MVDTHRLLTNDDNNCVEQYRITNMAGEEHETTKLLQEIGRYQRFELRDMPENGWVVDVDERSCACLFWYKRGNCVHVVAALMRNRIAFNGYTVPVLMMVNQHFQRSVSRANNRAARIARGRGGARGALGGARGGVRGGAGGGGVGGAGGVRGVPRGARARGI